jgi:predicted nucleotidyltransferase component of viral defense system
MNTIIEQMLRNYGEYRLTNRKNVVKEIMQEIVLYGLSKSGFFKQAAFYGGTALRIFYGLDRFSEDLDFSLLTSNENFDLSAYFSTLEKEMQSFGLNIEITEKEKRVDSNIQSAFLKANTKEHILLFYGDEVLQGIHGREKIKIKFEVDTNPPAYANIEHKYRLLPSPYEIALYDAPSLFAGKIHAVLCRAWKTRIKGRDLYDYIFFLSRSVPVNIAHLYARLVQSDYLYSAQDYALSDLKQDLQRHFETIDFKKAKEDVEPFVRNQESLSVWSSEFFIQITEQLTVAEK